jgi:hypothetical protein
MSRSWRIAAAGLAALAACATARSVGQALKGGSLDLLDVASGAFLPGTYGKLVSKFVDTLKGSPDGEPGSDSAASTPAIGGEGGEMIPSGSAASPEEPGEPEPLVIEFDLVKQALLEGTSVALPVRDGDILRDGGDDPEGGDNLRVLLRSSAPCWVYVVLVDATGKIDTLFPGTWGGGTNPVPPDVDLSVPAGSDWFYLDRNKGVETIYLFASREQRLDLEQLLADLEKAKPAATPPVRIDRPIPITRGIGGTRPGRERTLELKDGSQAAFTPGAFVVPASRSSEVVLTRWYRHE